jgi:hypothetical protein
LLFGQLQVDYHGIQESCAAPASGSDEGASEATGLSL